MKEEIQNLQPFDSNFDNIYIPNKDSIHKNEIFSKNNDTEFHFQTKYNIRKKIFHDKMINKTKEKKEVIYPMNNNSLLSSKNHFQSSTPHHFPISKLTFTENLKLKKKLFNLTSLFSDRCV